MRKTLILITLLATTIGLHATTSMRAIIERELQQSVYDHIGEKLKSVQVIEYPFPHIIVENILPDDLYEMAQSLWPEEHAFTANAHHFILPITNGLSEKNNLDHDQKIFWRLFGDIIVNRYIKPKITAKFIPYLPMKAGLEQYDISKFDITQDVISFHTDGLAFDTINYSIPIHLDQRNILAAMFIYMPIDDNHQEAGTQFFEGSPAENANTIYLLNPTKNPTLVKTVAYRPNTLVAFMQTPISWHAYLQSNRWEDKNYRRRLYQMPIYLSPEFMRRNIQDYPRSYIDDYFFHERYYNSQNWTDIWGRDE